MAAMERWSVASLASRGRSGESGLLGEGGAPLVVIVTASTTKQARAVASELRWRLDTHQLPDGTKVFAVPDPEGARVGSGGATLNALVTVSEMLLGSSGVSLSDCKVFMIHSGGDSQRSPVSSLCGKAWSALPFTNEAGDLQTPIDSVFATLMALFATVDRGLVVACSDVLFMFEDDLEWKWDHQGVVGLGIPLPAERGEHHGVYHLDADGTVIKFFQKESVATLEAAGAINSCGQVMVDSGIVFFHPDVVQRLLHLAQRPELRACTYAAVDAGSPPLRIELYSDIMMALGKGVGLTKQQYLRIAHASGVKASAVAEARKVLWEVLNDVPFHANCLPATRMNHVGTTKELVSLLTQPGPFRDAFQLQPFVCSIALGESADVARRSDVVIMNSVVEAAGTLGPGAVVEHSVLSGDWTVGAGALCSSLRSGLVGDCSVRIADHVCMQEVRPRGGGRLFTFHGVNDNIKANVAKDRSGTLCNHPWSAFFDAAARVEPADRSHDAEDGGAGDLSSPSSSASSCWLFDAIWPPNVQRDFGGVCTLWNAKLFPIVCVPSGTRADDSDGATVVDGDEWLIASWMQAPQSASPAIIKRWRDATRLSLYDVLRTADARTEFQWRRALRWRVHVETLDAALHTRSRSLVPFVRMMRTRASKLADDSHSLPCLSREQVELLTRLDTICAGADDAVAARAFAFQAELLWALTGWGGNDGVARPGGASHPAWRQPLVSLATLPVSESRASAVGTMARLRQAAWDSESRHAVGRAARHYLYASQVLIARCLSLGTVASPPSAAVHPAKLPVDVTRSPWHVADAPARLDVAGGWSDTPPITFEANGEGGEEGGGAVGNVAVAVDGVRPIGCRARASMEPGIRVYSRTTTPTQDGSGGDATLVATIGLLQHMQDHATPGAAAALVKCVLLLLRVVSLPPDLLPAQSLAVLHEVGTGTDTSAGAGAGAGAGSSASASSSAGAASSGAGSSGAGSGTASKATGSSAPVPSLLEQLSARLGPFRGLDIESWSCLPVGSGLGTSSILGSCVLMAMTSLLDLPPRSKPDNIAMVLQLEQLMSTGGGWQDQVGGWYPGFKLAVSPARVPVAVHATPLKDPSGRIADHLLLVYTGVTRLASNLLQRVLRKWMLQEDGMAGIVRRLRRNARDCTESITRGDVEAFGAHVSTYWAQKKAVAPGAEPPSVAAVIAVVASLCHGVSLMGAGGGGFMLLVTKAPAAEAKSRVAAALAEHASTASLGATVHAVTVDTIGLQTR